MGEMTEEGRSRLRKVSGRGQTPADPGMSEWSNPPANLELVFIRALNWREPTIEYIDSEEGTV